MEMRECVCVRERESDSPVNKGQVDGSCDIGGGENEDICVSLDLVQLSQQSIHHSDSI